MTTLSPDETPPEKTIYGKSAFSNDDGFEGSTDKTHADTSISPITEKPSLVNQNADYPITDNPTLDNPTLENPTQQNIDITNILNELNIDISTTTARVRAREENENVAPDKVGGVQER